MWRISHLIFLSRATRGDPPTLFFILFSLFFINSYSLFFCNSKFNIEEAICTLSDSKRYSTLVNNTILFAISNFGSKIISLIIQPYLSYALASPDVMGVTSLMQSVANLLIPVVSLGVSFAVIRFGLDRKVDKSSVFMNGLATILLGFA